MAIPIDGAYSPKPQGGGGRKKNSGGSSTVASSAATFRAADSASVESYKASAKSKAKSSPAKSSPPVPPYKLMSEHVPQVAQKHRPASAGEIDRNVNKGDKKKLLKGQQNMSNEVDRVREKHKVSKGLKELKANPRNSFIAHEVNTAIAHVKSQRSEALRDVKGDYWKDAKYYVDPRTNKAYLGKYDAQTGKLVAKRVDERFETKGGHPVDVDRRIVVNLNDSSREQIKTNITLPHDSFSKTTATTDRDPDGRVQKLQVRTHKRENIPRTGYVDTKSYEAFDGKGRQTAAQTKFEEVRNGDRTWGDSRTNFKNGVPVQTLTEEHFRAAEGDKGEGLYRSDARTVDSYNKDGQVVERTTDLETWSRVELDGGTSARIHDDVNMRYRNETRDGRVLPLTEDTEPWVNLRRETFTTEAHGGFDGNRSETRMEAWASGTDPTLQDLTWKDTVVAHDRRYDNNGDYMTNRIEYEADTATGQPLQGTDPREILQEEDTRSLGSQVEEFVEDNLGRASMITMVAGVVLAPFTGGLSLAVAMPMSMALGAADTAAVAVDISQHENGMSWGDGDSLKQLGLASLGTLPGLGALGRTGKGMASLTAAGRGGFAAARSQGVSIARSALAGAGKRAANAAAVLRGTGGATRVQRGLYAANVANAGYLGYGLNSAAQHAAKGELSVDDVLMVASAAAGLGAGRVMNASATNGIGQRVHAARFETPVADAPATPLGAEPIRPAHLEPTRRARAQPTDTAEVVPRRVEDLGIDPDGSVQVRRRNGRVENWEIGGPMLLSEGTMLVRNGDVTRTVEVAEARRAAKGGEPMMLVPLSRDVDAGGGSLHVTEAVTRRLGELGVARHQPVAVASGETGWRVGSVRGQELRLYRRSNTDARETTTMPLSEFRRLNTPKLEANPRLARIASDTDPVGSRRIEHMLEHAEIVPGSRRQLKAVANGGFRPVELVTLRDPATGVTMEAVIKHSDGGAAQEQFAYEVAKALGVDQHLPRIVRRGDGAAYMEYVDGIDARRQPATEERLLGAMARGIRRSNPRMSEAQANRRAVQDLETLRFLDHLLGVDMNRESMNTIVGDDRVAFIDFEQMGGYAGRAPDLSPAAMRRIVSRLKPEVLASAHRLLGQPVRGLAGQHAESLRRLGGGEFLAAMRGRLDATVDATVASLRPNRRHQISMVDNQSRVSARNTVIDGTVDVDADMRLIAAGEFTRESGDYVLANGRAYAPHGTGSTRLIPRSGPGIHQLSRFEYRALMLIKQAGGAEPASAALAAHVPPFLPEQIQRAAEVWNAHRAGSEHRLGPAHHPESGLLPRISADLSPGVLRRRSSTRLLDDAVTQLDRSPSGRELLADLKRVGTRITIAGRREVAAAVGHHGAVAYFDPKENRIVVSTAALRAPDAALTVAHEAVHALDIAAGRGHLGRDLLEANAAVREAEIGAQLGIRSRALIRGRNGQQLTFQDALAAVRESPEYTAVYGRRVYADAALSDPKVLQAAYFDVGDHVTAGRRETARAGSIL